MALSDKEKLDFMFKICVEMAERENVLPLYEIWSLKYDISEDYLSQSIKLISAAAKNNEFQGEASYIQLERTLSLIANPNKAKSIFGILYALREPNIVELLDQMINVPVELRSMMVKVKKEYE